MKSIKLVVKYLFHPTFSPTMAGIKKANKGSKGKSPATRLVDAPSQQVTNDEDWFDPPARENSAEEEPNHEAVLSGDEESEEEEDESDSDDDGAIKTKGIIPFEPDELTPIKVINKKRNSLKPDKVGSHTLLRLSAFSVFFGPFPLPANTQNPVKFDTSNSQKKKSKTTASVDDDTPKKNKAGTFGFRITGVKNKMNDIKKKYDKAKDGEESNTKKVETFKIKKYCEQTKIPKTQNRPAESVFRFPFSFATHRTVAHSSTRVESCAHSRGSLPHVEHDENRDERFGRSAVPRCVEESLLCLDATHLSAFVFPKK
tara:strand:- start:314 stop:1255 length:942 start_codon:yes stop_codon:yes gene_type:complete